MCSSFYLKYDALIKPHIKAKLLLVHYKVPMSFNHLFNCLFEQWFYTDVLLNMFFNTHIPYQTIGLLKGQKHKHEANTSGNKKNHDIYLLIGSLGCKHLMRCRLWSTHKSHEPTHLIIISLLRAFKYCFKLHGLINQLNDVFEGTTRALFIFKSGTIIN